MAWTFNGTGPIYLQLVDMIKRKIIVGEYPPGGHLPSVRDFAAEAAVNPNTMQRALTELEREGLIVTQRTSGREVTRDTDRIRREREQMAGAEVDLCLRQMKQLGFTAEDMIRMIEQRRDEATTA